MRYFEQNGWFHPDELMRAVTAVYQASPLVYMDAKQYGCKYIQLYIDQRTKSFIFRQGDGSAVPRDIVYEMYPELRDPD